MTVKISAGVTQETCSRITELPASFKLIQAGLDGVRSANHSDNLTPQVVLMTGTLTHKEESLTVMGHIEGEPCPMVVDTGANITIVRPDVLTKQLRNSVQATTSVLKTATGETATVHGKLQLKVKIGGAEVSHVALVADISDKFILILDFVMAHGCSVDTGVGSLRIGVEEVPLHKPLAFQVARCCQVMALEDTVISPYSEILVPAKIVGEPYGEHWGTVGSSPAITLPPGVMVGKTLVDAQHDYISLRMVDLTNEPRQIPSGIEVAACEGGCHLHSERRHLKLLRRCMHKA